MIFHYQNRLSRRHPGNFLEIYWYTDAYKCELIAVGFFCVSTSIYTISEEESFDSFGFFIEGTCLSFYHGTEVLWGWRLLMQGPWGCKFWINFSYFK
jgi:hypothetical protein